ELATLVRRISFALLVAGAFFLLMPLRFAFERPHTVGWLGQMFDGFRLLDQPFNLFPSLHITFWLILLDVYHRHARGLLRGVLHIWFFLIAISTVLTYQHHVMDVLGGLMLGGFCMYLFDERAVRLPVAPNERMAALYAAAAVTLLPVVF